MIEAITNLNYSLDSLPVIDLSYLILMKLIAERSQAISRMLGVAEDFELQQVKMVISQYLPSALEGLESLVVLGRLEKG